MSALLSGLVVSTLGMPASSARALGLARKAAISSCFILAPIPASFGAWSVPSPLSPWQRLHIYMFKKSFLPAATCAGLAAAAFAGALAAGASGFLAGASWA